MHHSRSRSGGYTLIEMLIVLAMLAGLFVAASIYRASLYDVGFAANELVGNLRLARASAISHGVHYRILVAGSDRYRVERMELDAGEWIPEPSRSREVRLPGNVVFDSPEGTVSRFDTRGMLVDPDGPMDLELRDERLQSVVALSIWPSGQVLASP